MRRVQSFKDASIRFVDLIGPFCAYIVVLGAVISALGPLIILLLGH